MGRMYGSDVLARCAYDDVELGSASCAHDAFSRVRHGHSMLHELHGRRDHQLTRLRINAPYRTTLLWAAQPLVATLRWPSGRTDGADGPVVQEHPLSCKG